jgi:hypothetical protein
MPRARSAVLEHSLATLSISRAPVRLRRDHPPQGGSDMKYLLLIYQGDTPTPADPEAWGKLSQDEQNAVYAAYGEINNNPNITPGVGMAQPETATTVRVDNGATLTTDGPFAELKEAIGGFFVLEADDLDGAIEIAAKVPAASMGGAIEIRPVVEY